MTSSSPVTRVEPFPLSMRTSLVRRCAAELENVHGVEAVAYWRKECRQLADELLSLGCDDGEMRAQIADFQEAVQIEMMTRHHGVAESRSGS